MKDVRENQTTPSTNVQEVPQIPAVKPAANSMKPMRSMVSRKSLRPLKVYGNLKAPTKREH